VEKRKIYFEIFYIILIVYRWTTDTMYMAGGTIDPAARHPAEPGWSDPKTDRQTMSRKQTSKPAAAPVAAPVVVVKPAVDPNKHTFENVLIDSMVKRLMADGHRVDVAAIATAAGSKTASTLATTIAGELAKLAAASGNAAAALDAKRINKHLHYAIGVGANANPADWIARSERRPDGAAAARAVLAAAVKPVAKKRNRKS
jgi:hypothetical protein